MPGEPLPMESAADYEEFRFAVRDDGRQLRRGVRNDGDYEPAGSEPAEADWSREELEVDAASIAEKLRVPRSTMPSTASRPAAGEVPSRRAGPVRPARVERQRRATAGTAKPPISKPMWPPKFPCTAISSISLRSP